jgi:hypothetical protein
LGSGAFSFLKISYFTLQRLVVTIHTASFNTNNPTISYAACSFLDDFGGENGRKVQFSRPGRRWQGNIKINV